LHLRRRETPAWWDDPQHDQPEAARAEPADRADVARDVEAGDTAGTIAECFERMTPRARLVWLLRVFCELSSEEVAAHPDLNTTPAAVDTMLMRCRQELRRCVQAKGFDPASLPVGTLTALWEMVMMPDRVTTQARTVPRENLPRDAAPDRSGGDHQA
jgi:hypothetical protein